MTGLLYISPIAGIESPRAGDFISSEANAWRSRDQVPLAPVGDSATSYLAGVVLGKQVIGSKAAFAMGAGSTGVLTCGTITLSAGVQQGVYEAVCIVAGATARYEISNASGVLVGVVTVGTAFSGGGLAFTLSNTTNSVVGDIFIITVGTAAFANTGGDTGNGTCSAIVVQPGVIGGTYTFTCTVAGATATFTGVDPFGNILPPLTVGTAYNGGGLTFTITSGGTAYIVGDSFTVTTYTGNDEYYPVNASAYDGTQNAAGILVFQTYVGAATVVQVAVVSRQAEVKAGRLCWPSTTTDDQQRNWIAQLAALGIIVRRDLV